MSRIVDDLKRFEDTGCESCRAFRPDCWVPKTDGSDGAHALCWLCAHAVLAHDMPIGGQIPDCACDAAEIFPPDVLARKERLSQTLDNGEDRSQKAVPVVRQPNAPEPAAEPSATFTTYSPSYNEQGKRDPDGPVLVQTFRRLDATRIELVSATVRPRVARVTRTLARRRTVGTD